MKLHAALAASALAFSASANASPFVFFDDFNGENAANGGVSVLNYDDFIHFDVTGQVDLVKSGDFGIACVGGTGLCVDLDGSSGPGSLITNFTFFYAAGDTVTLSFAISGNQRGGGPDEWFAALDSSDGIFSTGGIVNWNDPFATYSISFTGMSDGQASFSFGTTSGDSIGPILDDIIAGVSPPGAVPEPASWAMMIGGFALAGVAMRRRKAAARLA